MRNLFGAAVLSLASWAAAAQDVAIALTEDVVEIDAGFSGAEIVLFGVVSTAEPGAFDAGEFDVAAVVKGPQSTFRLRPFERRRMIWTPGPAIDIVAPGVLLTLSTKPLDDLASADSLRALGVGASAAAYAQLVTPQSERGAAHVAAAGAETVAGAFIGEARRRGLIRDVSGAVDFRKAGLFSIGVALPPITPVGAYSVDVFLFRNRKLVSRDLASLIVRKTGVESGIYDLAHRQPVVYGVAAAAFSILTGLLAAAAFRRA